MLGVLGNKRLNSESVKANRRTESRRLPGAVVPYASGELRARFDAWLDDTLKRHSRALEFREIRQGVRALSSLWLERRAGGELARRAIEGQGKRAALASYFAALHFLTLHHTLEHLGDTTLSGIRRIFDLGCGTGACGAALGAAVPTRTTVFGVDRSAWVLGEARRTWSHFGLRQHTRRAELPEGMPEGSRGDLLMLGWVVNEIDAGPREELRKALRAVLGRGARVLIAEPLARSVSPWWESWCEALDARSEIVKLRIERPAWIEEMDRASGLDHSTLGARVLLAGPTPRGD